jgi:hypothetical protein
MHSCICTFAYHLARCFKFANFKPLNPTSLMWCISDSRMIHVALDKWCYPFIFYHQSWHQASTSEEQKLNEVSNLNLRKWRTYRFLCQEQASLARKDNSKVDSALLVKTFILCRGFQHSQWIADCLLQHSILLKLILILCKWDPCKQL